MARFLGKDSRLSAIPVYLGSTSQAESLSTTAEENIQRPANLPASAQEAVSAAFRQVSVKAFSVTIFATRTSISATC